MKSILLTLCLVYSVSAYVDYSGYVTTCLIINTVLVYSVVSRKINVGDNFLINAIDTYAYIGN